MKQMYIVMCAVVIAIAMVMLDQTVLPVALPIIQGDLHATQAQMHWTIDGYFLTMAVFMLAGGRLADLFGQRRMFSLGISIFALGSLCCGLSPNSASLIASRFVQGIGGAFLLPPSIPLLLAAFPDNKKGLAVGLQTAFSSFFLIMGPFIGGLFAQYLTWRYIFWINLPLSVLGLFLTFRYVPKLQPIPRHFDFLGFFCYSIGIVCLTIALIQVEVWGWSAIATETFFILGAIFLSLLYFTDKRTHDPFVDFSLFRHKIFKASGLNIFIAAFVLIITVFLPIYMQKVLSFSPVEAGFYLAVTSIPIAIASPFAGELLDRFGFKVPVILGQTLVLASFVWIVAFLPFDRFLYLVPALLLMSVGITSIMSPSFTAGIACIPAENRGLASGIVGTIRALGANFGIAATGTLIFDTQSKLFTKKMASESLSPTVFDHLSQLPPAVQALYNDSYRLAFGLANSVDAIVCAIGLFAMLIWFRKKKAA
jgi:EmrB/QacA subfamily drug resistance transporter